VFASEEACDVRRREHEVTIGELHHFEYPTRAASFLRVRLLGGGSVLEASDNNALVESYYGHIVRRCRARTRNEPEALEVAAEAAIRLLDELKRGRTYTVPYRVVVNKVIGSAVSLQPARCRPADAGSTI
jgi:hypothetical protein